MANPTSNLRLELQTTGSNANTWGDVTNVNLRLIEDAISGLVEIATTGGTTTLTTEDGSAVYASSEDEARFAILKITGTLTGNATIVIPAVSKAYYVWNATTGSYTVTVKVAGTGEIVTQGKRKIIICDGTEVYSAFTDTGTAGDCSTNTAESVDSELALFSSTTGKIIKRAAITGLVKAASGVAAAATANEDYSEPFFDINTQLVTSYTFVLSDAYNKYCRFNNAAAISVTVPPNSSVSFPVGTVLNIRRVGTGTVTFVESSGVTINNRVSLILDGNHDSARLIKVGTNEWDLVGPYEMPDICTDLACTSAANTWTGPQRGAYRALAITSGNDAEVKTAPNFGLSNNFSYTLVEDIELDAPTNAVAGQSGVIHFTQHASAAKTLAFDAFWGFGVGVTPEITTTLSGTAVMSYIVDPGATSATCSWVNKA